MRSEQEMLRLITRTAQEDPRIRAAYLEGSRANPKIPPDIFQDYDIVYIVEETTSFRADKAWINRFGERLYMQVPEDGAYTASNVDACYGWLMQFTDGNRLDLHVCTASYAQDHLELYQVLVDKDAVMPRAQVVSDEIYWVKKPREQEFSCTCNEFWWCMNNVAKGLWRGESPYVMDMLDFNVRPMLKRVLAWRVGAAHDFSVSVGKAGKYLSRYLPEQTYRQFLATYSPAEPEAVWHAVFLMCDLFQATAVQVSEALRFSYDFQEAENSRGYLERIRVLPADAKEMD